MADALPQVDGARRLAAILDEMGDLGVALSGGVDSMTLAEMAHRSSARATMFHAVSPAVPAHATDRVRETAAARGWTLEIVGAGEFEDPAYMANPVNRCYFCKSNLYARLRAATEGVICSGTNTDDLGDFRPGLAAAGEQGVRHPFVEAGIDKAGIRSLARALGLADVAELPAQPCLSSRVETGIAIDADALAMIDRVERRVTGLIGPGDIRCRMTKAGFVIELPAERMGDLRPLDRRMIEAELVAAGYRLAGVRPYRKGSAFLRAVGQ